MKRKEIFEKLSKLDLDKEEYIIISGASLVVQGIILETSDIDLATSMNYYRKINWPIIKGAFGIDIKYWDVFEISFNLYDKKNIVLIEGYKFMNLEKILEIKEKLNREKDRTIIEILKKNKH